VSKAPQGRPVAPAGINPLAGALVVVADQQRAHAPGNNPNQE
jgi:hypothetical protein